MMSVHMGTENDLKSVMQKKGMKLNALMQGELRPGEPNDMMYVKFADQFLAKAQYDNALFYIEQALAMNPNCKVCIIYHKPFTTNLFYN